MPDDDDRTDIPRQGWLRVKLHSHLKWHRRYCTIDWDKAILLIGSKVDGQTRDWIKLLPKIFIHDGEFPADNIIEIRADNETHLLQAESKLDYDCWFAALKRTAYSRVGGGIFGQSLEETYRHSSDKVCPVPLIVRQCCQYLLEYGSTFVGLFRIPGKQSSIKELRDLYDRGVPVTLSSSYSPATISSLLKIYLQSLPEPIIPKRNFDDFLAMGSRLKYDQTDELTRLKQLIETSLPSLNYTLLEYLCSFLKRLTEHVHTTKMDSDNLAVTFGNNLIRPSEDLDLNMIKGHNYNLLPLIKALIDHSDQLFTNPPAACHDACEQHNESLAKSSGFSSSSSLLSSQEQPIVVRSRSSSVPSVRLATCPSFDSANLSCDHSFDASDMPLGSKHTSLLSDQLTSQQSFVTCFERETSIDDDGDEEEGHTDARRPSVAEHLQAIDNVLQEPAIPFQVNSDTSCSSVHKTIAKKGFANKFGKSLSNFKSSVSKAFHPHSSSIENLAQTPTIVTSMSQATITVCNPSNQRRRSDTEGKALENEIDVLRHLLGTKETLLVHLTKTVHDEREKYEREKLQLHQTIERLQRENAQLKAVGLSDVYRT